MLFLSLGKNFNFDQIFCEVVQDFAAVFGDQDQVFDSYADAAWDIDARFYGEAHAWFQDFFVGEGDIVKLVDFQSRCCVRYGG